ncbi:MAG: tetratricopeptide repeat protein [Candidatus Omnitrophica bacterium]|nr:tetratricopeptide repeat protein [Candidatus Omnitrophota bacterium]
MRKILLSLVFFISINLIGFNLSAAPDSGDKKASKSQTVASELKKGQPSSLSELPKNLSEKMEKKVSLDLRDMGVVDVFQFLGKQGSLNIVATNQVGGRVTLFLKEVSIKDIVDIVLFTNDLAMVVENDVITIMTEEEYKNIYGEKYIDKRIAEIVKLKYASPDKIGSILGNIKSSIGEVVVDSKTATVILIDTPKKVEEMKEVLVYTDIPTIERKIPTVTEVFELEYAKVADIQDAVKDSLSEEAGEVRADQRTNTLVVTSLKDNMGKIERLIKAFDAQTKSVFISAKIIELTTTDNYYMGIDWAKIFEKASDLRLDGTFPYGGGAASNLQLAVGEIIGDNYEVTINWLKELGNVEIISSPQIYVNNNQEAKFMVGTREAYVTSTVTTGEATTTTSENVEFIDVGINLYVTPTINKGGYVKLHIKPEISSVKETLTTSEGNEIPIVSTSNVDTDVLIKDGHTIVMAGLIKETNTKEIKKVPLLGDIPLIKNAFRNVKDEKQIKELVIFLTPTIVTGKDMKAKDKEKVKEKPQKEIKEEIKEKVREPKDKKTEKKPKLKQKEMKVEKEDESYQYYYQLGLSQERNKNYQQAVDSYKKSLEINPDNAIVHLYLADIYTNYIKDFQKAESHFRKYKILTTMKKVKTRQE